MFGLRRLKHRLLGSTLDNKEMLRTAFAGDGIQKTFVVTAAEAFGLQRFIETGTWTGKTALWLATTFPDSPVLTCEVVPSVFKAAKKRLQRRPNVTCVLRDSGEWLEEMCAVAAAPQTLFFLDAHGMSLDWTLEPPLTRELTSIRSLTTPTVVIVDDFQVPGRPDYAFCVNGRESSFGYPNAERMGLCGSLNLALIESLLDADDCVLFPRYTFDDALTFQKDPLHGNLIGYAVVLHACGTEALDRFLSHELVASYYIRAR